MEHKFAAAFLIRQVLLLVSRATIQEVVNELKAQGYPVSYGSYHQRFYRLRRAGHIQEVGPNAGKFGRRERHWKLTDYGYVQALEDRKLVTRILMLEDPRKEEL